jgi:hypothetical protein
MEREKLEREIHQLTQIIGRMLSLWFPSPRPSRTGPDCKKQIDIRTTIWAGLLKQLGGDSRLGTAELRGAHAQA